MESTSGEWTLEREEQKPVKWALPIAIGWLKETPPGNGGACPLVS